MLPSAKNVVITKTWFEDDGQYEKVLEVAVEDLRPIEEALKKKKPAGMFFFSHSGPRHVVEFIDNQNRLIKAIELRGILLEDNGDWFSVGELATDYLDKLLEHVRKKKVAWNETLDALMSGA